VMDKPAIERKEMLRALVGGSAHPALQFVEHFGHRARPLRGGCEDEPRGDRREAGRVALRAQ